jgi:hypothetical protein
MNNHDEPNLEMAPGGFSSGTSVTHTTTTSWSDPHGETRTESHTEGKAEADGFAICFITTDETNEGA